MARILILARDGTVCDHLDYAYFRMLEEGFDVTIAGPEKRGLKTAVHQASAGEFIYTIERQGYITEAHAAFDEVDPPTFDGLLLPGGRGPEYLRNDKRCIDVVRHFVERDKPIGAICHGPLLLLEAGVTGRRLTCTDDTGIEVELAGNTYVEAQGVAAGQPDHILDGNIVTVRRRPFHHVWIRQFLALLEKQGIERPRKFEFAKSRILIIAGDFTSGGQLLYAVDRMREEGFDVTVAAPVKKRLDTVIDMREEGREYDFERLGFWMPADATLDEIDPSTFDGLVLPGWRATEYLRNMEGCRNAIRHFIETNKPIGAICQAPRLLIAAGVKGRRMTGLIKSEISRGNTYVAAGAEPVRDGNIVTVSRRPYYHAWMGSFLSLLRERNAQAVTAG
jgi:protease I